MGRRHGWSRAAAGRDGDDAHSVARVVERSATVEVEVADAADEPRRRVAAAGHPPRVRHPACTSQTTQSHAVLPRGESL